MNYNKAIKLLVSIIICELAGFAGAIFTTPEINSWYVGLNKPFFNPPNWIFGPVWTTLFVLMGISLYLVWNEKFVVKNKISKFKKQAWNKISQKFFDGKWQKLNIILVFAIQLFLNVLWSVVFFGMHSPGAAFFVLIMLWFAILFMIVNFYKVSKISAWLSLPYILWVSFAGILNYFIWILN